MTRPPTWIPIALTTDPTIVGSYRIIPGRDPWIEVEYQDLVDRAAQIGSAELTARQLLSELSRQGNAHA